jgi:hypothetical protein
MLSAEQEHELDSIRRASATVATFHGPSFIYGLALVLSIGSTALAALTPFLGVHPQSYEDRCPAADARVVDVVPVSPVAGAKLPAPTPPGSRFPDEDRLRRVSGVVAGGRRHEAPWHAWAERYGFTSPVPCTDEACEIVPSALVSKGLALEGDDAIVLLRVITYDFGTGLISSSYRMALRDEIFVARGAGAAWRVVVIPNPGEVAPASRIDGDDLVVCFTSGVRRIPLATMAGGRFEPFERRLVAALAPSWPWAAALVAILACAAIPLIRARAARGARQLLSRSKPCWARVTSVGSELLELRIDGGEEHALEWPRVIDVFRTNEGLCVLADPLTGLVGTVTKAWDVEGLVAGQRVSVVIEPRAQPKGPYRSREGVTDTWAFVLHEHVTLRDAARAIDRLAFPRRASWLAFVLALSAAIVTSTAAVAAFVDAARFDLARF